MHQPTITRAEKAARQQEALSRATTGNSTANYQAIIEGFRAKGIPDDQIIPRVTILSFNAWKALGRSVKPGQHGVKCLTYVEMSAKADADKPAGDSAETRDTFRAPRSVTVFHISQTESDTERAQRLQNERQTGHQRHPAENSATTAGQEPPAATPTAPTMPTYTRRPVTPQVPALATLPAPAVEDLQESLF